MGVIAGSGFAQRISLRSTLDYFPNWFLDIMHVSCCPIPTCSLSHLRAAWFGLAASIIFSSFVVVFQLRMVMLW